MLLSACSQGGERKLERGQLLAVEDAVCTWGEAQVFILTQHSAYAGEYGSMIWQVQLGDGNFEDYIRESLLEYLKMLLLANYGARRLEVRLSEVEQRAIAQATDAFFEDLGDEALKRGILKEDVKNAYTHYAMAQIFYRQIMTDAPLEISDEEARIIQVRVIRFEESNGYEQAAEAAELLKNGASPAELARRYDGISLKTENLIHGQYSDEFDTLVFALEDGQISPIIREDGAYLIVQCLSSFLVNETRARKAAMEEQVREETLAEALKGFIRTTQILYNPKLWESWTMEQYASSPNVDFFRYAEALSK